MIVRVGNAMTLPISDDHWLDLSPTEDRTFLVTTANKYVQMDEILTLLYFCLLVFFLFFLGTRHVINFETLQKLAFDQREQHSTMHQLALVTYRTIYSNANYLYVALKRCQDVAMLQSFCQAMNVLDIRTCQSLALNEDTLIDMISRAVFPPGLASSGGSSGMDAAGAAAAAAAAGVVYPGMLPFFNFYCSIC